MNDEIRKYLKTVGVPRPVLPVLVSHAEPHAWFQSVSTSM